MIAAGLGLDVDQVADGHVDVDYMPATNPDRPRPADVEMVTVPLWLLVAARADAVSDRDRARDEFALLAPAGSPAGQVGDARVKQWAAMHPGYVALIDYPIGGSR